MPKVARCKECASKTWSVTGYCNTCRKTLKIKEVKSKAYANYASVEEYEELHGWSGSTPTLTVTGEWERVFCARCVFDDCLGFDIRCPVEWARRRKKTIEETLEKFKWGAKYGV